MGKVHDVVAWSDCALCHGDEAWLDGPHSSEGASFERKHAFPVGSSTFSKHTEGLVGLLLDFYEALPRNNFVHHLFPLSGIRRPGDEQ